jgi:NDP-4-keto-2,6-dideoxyhexose 3-C-methyltransferase
MEQCKQIQECRICKSKDLEQVLDLGNHVLTGVFPRDKNQEISSGPLRLVKCFGECGLLQLEHTFSLPEMYGDNYGYRSGLNASMTKHLQNKVARIVELYNPSGVVLDIGSNDGTTLAAYPSGLKCIGIDPTASKFLKYYTKGVIVVSDFFSESAFREASGNELASVVTSFSMFYDLENPLGFMQEVSRILAPNGVWVFEQSYMPTMLKNNSYDTVCHEHLEYYGMKQIQWMLEKTGLKAIDIEFNNINGGSFSVTAAKIESSYKESDLVKGILNSEIELGFDGALVYKAFSERATKNKNAVLEFFSNRRSGSVIGALGASTKGNVFLQYCNLTSKDIVAIGEINSDKFGSFTPGTFIPIVPEHELLDMNPEYLIVLPWHFRSAFEKSRHRSRLIFAFPEFEVV